MEKCYFLAYNDATVFLSLTKKFSILKEKFCEIRKLIHFFHKKVHVFFTVCVFLPRSLLPFGKNLDSKRTIYFEWPNYYSR